MLNYHVYMLGAVARMHQRQARRRLLGTLPHLTALTLETPHPLLTPLLTHLLMFKNCLCQERKRRRWRVEILNEK